MEIEIKTTALTVINNELKTFLNVRGSYRYRRAKPRGITFNIIQ